MAITLTELREKAGKKPADTAKYMSVSRSSILRWEEGKEDPRISKLEQIADFYSTTPEVVLRAWIGTKKAYKQQCAEQQLTISA
jgi:transcriptional regulator with XRE-family HTH domain